MRIYLIVFSFLAFIFIGSRLLLAQSDEDKGDDIGDTNAKQQQENGPGQQIENEGEMTEDQKREEAEKKKMEEEEKKKKKDEDENEKPSDEEQKKKEDEEKKKKEDEEKKKKEDEGQKKKEDEEKKKKEDEEKKPEDEEKKKKEDEEKKKKEDEEKKPEDEGQKPEDEEKKKKEDEKNKKLGDEEQMKRDGVLREEDEKRLKTQVMTQNSRTNCDRFCLKDPADTSPQPKCLSPEAASVPAILKCPMPVADPAEKPGGKAWKLVQIFFNQDPRICAPNSTHLALAFDISDSAAPEANEPVPEPPADEQECPAESGYLICYESKMDPGRRGKPLEYSHSMANEDNNMVATMCNENLQVGDEPYRWQGMVGHLHGLLVSFVGKPNAGILQVQTSYSADKVYYKMPLRMVVLKAGSMISHFFALDPRSSVWAAPPTGPLEPIKGFASPKLDKEFEAKIQPTMKLLVNGLPLASERFRGPWLVGPDMFLHYSNQFYLKTTPLGNAAACVPKVEYLSSITVNPPNKRKVCKKPPCPEEEWEVVTDAQQMPKEWKNSNAEGSRVQLKEDHILVTFPADDMTPLTLTFAVPEEAEFTINNLLDEKVQEECFLKAEGPRTTCADNENAYSFVFNQLPADQCQLTFRRLQDSVCVTADGIHKTAILAGKDNEFLFAGENVFLDFDGFNVNAEASQQKQFALNETLVLPEKCALKNTPIGEFGMVNGAMQPYVLQLTISLRQPFKCDTAIELAFYNSQYELLVPKKAEVVPPPPPPPPVEKKEDGDEKPEEE